jgi:hypothetical protein
MSAIFSIHFGRLLTSTHSSSGISLGLTPNGQLDAWDVGESLSTDLGLRSCSTRGLDSAR